MENQGILRVCTAYLPPLDYFAAILKAGSFCIDTDETYPKQTFPQPNLPCDIPRRIAAFPAMRPSQRQSYAGFGSLA